MHPPGASQASSGTRRAVQILGAVVVVVVLPIVLVDALVGQSAADAMFLGLYLGVLGSQIGGSRRMILLVPAFGLAAGLGAFTAYGWWWVVMVAVMGVVAGAGTRVGWLPSLLMLPVAATFAVWVQSGRDAVVYGVVAGLGAAYGVVLARRFAAPKVVNGQRLSFAAAAAVAIVSGIALGASAAIGVALGWTEPYWVPEPILLLTVSIIMGKRERIRQKAIATAVGAVAAVPIAVIAPPSWAMSIIATAAFVLALTQHKERYVRYYTLLTFALVLALSPPGDVGAEAAHRSSEILIGIGILVVGLAVLHPLGDWLSKHDPQPELAQINAG